MTAYVDELLAEAAIAAPGCPEPLIERMLRTAASDFYRASYAWRINTDLLSVRAGSREVDIELPTNTIGVKVYWAKLAGKVLSPIAARNLADGNGPPRGYAVSPDSSMLLLDVIPDRNYQMDGVELHLAVAPTTALVDLPDHLFAAHRDGILYGAISRLLAMPNVGWANLTDAGTYMAMMRTEQAKASRESEALQAPITRVVSYGGI